MTERSADERASAISIRPLDPGAWAPATWDHFAAHCGGSMRSAHCHLLHLGVRLFNKGRVRTYGLYLKGLPGGEPIGWFTVVVGLRVTRFFDGLRLRPEHEPRWLEAMQTALQFLGPGRYEYGWALSLEPSRAAALARLSEVSQLQASEVLVHAVDFARWPDWASYYRDISENSRRNARKALKIYPDLRVETHGGLNSLAACASLLRHRAEMYKRKGLAFRWLRSLAGYVAGAFLCPEQAMIALARADHHTLAAFRSVEFEDLTYYLEGAGAPGAEGASWFLQLDMAERAYRRAPHGKFLLGFVRYPVVRDLPEGLIRSRRALGATEFPTSTLSFQVSAGAPAT